MFAKVLAAACLLLMAVGGVVWGTVDGTRGAEKKLRAGIATIMGAGDGDER